jgi:hypothetical protein
MRIARLVLAFVVGGVSSASLAAPCAGFTDVQDTSAFCPNVEWVKNRNITLGCTSPTLYCPNDPVTRLSMAVFMNRLGNALFPLNCTTGQVMRWNGTAWACANDNAPIEVTYPAGGFTRPAATTPTILYQLGHLLLASADGSVILGLGAPTRVGGIRYRLSMVEWCIAQAPTNNAFVTTAAVAHDQPGAPGSPLALAVSDPTDRNAAGCYVLDVPEVSPRGYALVLALAGQTPPATTTGIMLSSVKGTWVAATVSADGEDEKPLP